LSALMSKKPVDHKIFDPIQIWHQDVNI